MTKTDKRYFLVCALFMCLLGAVVGIRHITADAYVANSGVNYSAHGAAVTLAADDLLDMHLAGTEVATGKKSFTASAAAGSIILGASGTQGSLWLYPATAAKGKVVFDMLDFTNNITSTIRMAAQTNGVNQVLTIPASGDTASFIMSSPTSSQSINGGVSMDTQLTSTVSTGTSPFAISSTTKSTNLHADAVDFVSFSGPTVARTKTISDAADTIAELNTANAFTAAQSVKSAGAGVPQTFTVPRLASATDTSLTVAGSGAGTNLTTGAYNTLYGFGVGDTITGGSRNVAIGTDNFGAAGSTGINDSVAIGHNAGKNATNGTDVYIGSFAGELSTSGNQNCIVGAYAGRGSGALADVTAIGYGSANVCIVPVTAVGSRAGIVVTGANNTLVGKDCGDSLTSGTGNCIFGDSADVGTNSFSNSIIIGNAAVNTAANQAVFGSATSAATSVYFGEGVQDATPLAYTINGTGSRPASDSNVAGGNITIASGRGTGSGAVTSLILQTPATVGGATDAQTMTTRMTLAGGDLQVERTITAAGTTGNRTIDKMAGRVNVAAAGTTVTVTNAYCTTSSIVLATIGTNDATATMKNCVPGAGSFVITFTAAATAEVAVNWWIIN